MGRSAIGIIGGALTLAVLLGATAAPAQKAQPVSVERIEVVRTGTYRIEVNRPVPDRSISTGNRIEARSYKNLLAATQVEARKDTTIGAELTIVGTPRRGKVPIKVVWRYPPPGLINPDTKEAKTMDEYADVQLVGVSFPVFWGLTQDWQVVPGTWTLEVWHGERKLLGQEFHLVRP